MASIKPEKPHEDGPTGNSPQGSRPRGPFTAAARALAATTKFNVAASPFVMNPAKLEPSPRHQNHEHTPRVVQMHPQMTPAFPLAASSPIPPPYRSILGRDPRARPRILGPVLPLEQGVVSFFVSINLLTLLFMRDFLEKDNFLCSPQRRRLRFATGISILQDPLELIASPMEQFSSVSGKV